LPGGTDYTEIVLKLNKDIPVMQNRPLPEKVLAIVEANPIAFHQ